MNNIIDQIEERALASQEQKIPCRKCGKPISNRGKRMHDLFCYAGKKSQKPFFGEGLQSKSRSPAKQNSLKSFSPSSIFGWSVKNYAWFLDLCFQKTIDGGFWFWLWGTMFVVSLLLPVYFILSLFLWVERLFSVVVSLWRLGANGIGFTVGMTQNANDLAAKIANGTYKDIGKSFVNFYIGRANTSDVDVVQTFGHDFVSTGIQTITAS